MWRIEPLLSIVILALLTHAACTVGSPWVVVYVRASVPVCALMILLNVIMLVV